MRTRGRTKGRATGRAGLAAALVVAAVALTSCVGIGAVNQGRLTAEAQQRGGGVTSALVDDAIAEVAAATGERPLAVHSITASLATVTVVVPAADGATGRDAWRYGTAGIYGGKGLEGPTPSPDPAPAAFTVDVEQLDVDAAVDTAREAGPPGGWVESLTVSRPSDEAAPVTTVVVTAGSLPTTVVIDADGGIVSVGQS